MMTIRNVFITLFVSFFFISCGGGSSNSSTSVDAKPSEDAYAKIKAYIESEGNSTAPITSDYATIGATGVNSENVDEVNALLLKYITSQYVQSANNVKLLANSILGDSPISIMGEDEVMQTKSISLELNSSSEHNISKLEWLDGNASIFGSEAKVSYQAMQDVGSALIVARVIFDDNTVALASKEIRTIAYQNTLTKISGTPTDSIYQDDPYSFTPNIENEDNDTLNFNATNLPSWLSVDSRSGKVYGVPTNSDVGVAKDINLSVDDGKDVVSLAPFDITVINVNDAPSISGSPDTQAYEDSNYSFIPMAIDIDANTTLLFSSQAFPAWLSIDSQTGVVSGTPNYGDVGLKNALRVIVSDGLTTDYIEFRLEIIAVNDAPIIEVIGSVVDVYEDSNWSLDLEASDEEGDSFSFRANNLPTWASIEASTGLISGTPTNDDVGLSELITVFVQDIHGDESNISFKINVINTNDAPTFKITQLPNALEDALYQYKIEVEDVDPDDRLEFEATNLPSWSTIRPANGEIVGIPTNDDVGMVRDINISVSDGNVTIYKLLDLEVINTNDAPTISGKPTRDSIPVSIDFKFTPDAQDVDLNTTLSFSIANNPSWMVINSSTGEVGGEPSVDDIGDNHGIVVSVSDGIESVALDEFNVSVTPITKPLKTGQSIVYTQKDDGTYATGEVRSFTRADDIVTSTSTGKMWQDDSSVATLKKRWLSETNYIGNRHEDTSGDTAASYCETLTLGGYGDWRLPTIKELMTLTDKSKTSNSIDDVFENGLGDIYWSATSLKYESSKAWAVKFDYGVDRWEDKSKEHYVRCIRDKE